MIASGIEVTPIALTMTIESPGTIRPISTLVSSMIATLAMRIRSHGSTPETTSRIDERTSLSIP